MGPQTGSRMSALHPKLVSNLVVVSGIPAGDSGTGRFVAHLQARLAELVGKGTKVISRPDRLYRWQVRLFAKSRGFRFAARVIIRHGFLLGRFWWRIAIVLLRRRQRMILLHPQNLGYRLALRLIESRRQPCLLYLLDSSFFCIVSYNHLRGENGSCLRCIEFGFDQIAKNGCEPFPRPDPAARGYLPRLKELVRAGRTIIAAQNVRQAEARAKAFRIAVVFSVIGLWAQDFDEVVSGKPGTLARTMTRLVIPGTCCSMRTVWTPRGLVGPQGWHRHCPELRFMFPFALTRLVRGSGQLQLCAMQLGWLAYAMAGNARFVVVPSLRSASDRGCAGESIACAKRQSSWWRIRRVYSDELPPDWC